MQLFAESRTLGRAVFVRVLEPVGADHELGDGPAACETAGSQAEDTATGGVADVEESTLAFAAVMDLAEVPPAATDFAAGAALGSDLGAQAEAPGGRGQCVRGSKAATVGHR